MKIFFNRTSMVLVATLALAGTLHTAPIEMFVGPIFSLDRYEHTATFFIPGASAAAWKKQEVNYQLHIVATCKTVNGNGSMILRLPILDDPDDNMLSLLWNGAEQEMRLFTGISGDISGSSNDPKELTWRLRFAHLSGAFYLVKFDTWDENGNRWNVKHSVRIVSSNLQEWVENGAEIEVGLADASLENIVMETHREPTLLLIR